MRKSAASTTNAARPRGRARVLAQKRRRREERRDTVGADEIVCRLCHKVFRAITIWHLWRIHDFEGEHPVQEYKRRYGLRVAVCQELSAKQRRLRTAHHEARGHHWTNARIYAELRRRARAGRPLAPTQLGNALNLAIGRLIGSYDLAMRRAGLDPLEHRQSGVWSDDRILQVIRAASRSGPVTFSRMRREKPGSVGAASRRLGSWTKALQLAGLNPAEHRVSRRIPLAQVTRWITARRARPFALRSHLAPSSYLVVVKRETGQRWSDYVTSLGIVYPGVRKRLDWTREAVLTEIRGRRRARLPLNRGAVASESQALTHQARKRLGSWDQALRAAGIDPAGVRLSHAAWTSAEILAALRRRHREGASLRMCDVKAENPGLLRAAQDHFPSSLARALGAAGLDPRLAAGGIIRARGLRLPARYRRGS